MFRKWERRFALTAEYGIKTIYAALIGFGTKSAYSADEMRRGIVTVGMSDSLPGTIALDRGYRLFFVDRYNPFRDALLALSDRAGEVRIAEISGSDFVTMSGSAPANWRVPPRARVIVAYEVPGERPRNRILLRTSARDLLDVIHGLRVENKYKIEHIYDY
jgi:hypothetical protein